jgi:hypothetical protein
MATVINYISIINNQPHPEDICIYNLFVEVCIFILIAFNLNG